MFAWGARPGSGPKSAAALFAILIMAAQFGCSRPQPLSPARSHEAPSGAESSAPSAPDLDEPTAPQGTAANLDPVLQITLPRPSAFLRAIVPPTFTVRWEASDPDARSNRPLEYRYILFDDELEFIPFLVNPDSLRRRDGPSFANWTPIRGRHEELELRDLEINKSHLLVIVAIDADGGYNQVFTLNTNMLTFVVGHPASLGARLQITGDLQYQTPGGGRFDDPSTAPHFVVPMEQALSIQWSAQPTFGDVLNGTRWTLDPTKLDDTSHGSGRDGGWSGWSLTVAAASVGPFATPGEHRLYIEARTELGTLTRLLLILEVVPTTEVARARGD